MNYAKALSKVIKENYRIVNWPDDDMENFQWLENQVMFYSNKTPKYRNHLFILKMPDKSYIELLPIRLGTQNDNLFIYVFFTEK